MDNKRSVLNSFDSFNDAGLKNVDKVSYQSFNLIIGENGAGKTRFLKSLLNEMKKTNNYRVITMFFPDLLDVKGDMENDEEADYIFDLLQGNTDVDFRDFLRIMPIQSFDHVEHFGYCSPLSIMKSVPARLSCHLRYRNPARLQMSSPFRCGAEIRIRQASSPN